MLIPKNLLEIGSQSWNQFDIKVLNLGGNQPPILTLNVIGTKPKGQF
jgi:hypothetical protein